VRGQHTTLIRGIDDYHCDHFYNGQLRICHNQPIFATKGPTTTTTKKTNQPHERIDVHYWRVREREGGTTKNNNNSKLAHKNARIAIDKNEEKF